MGAAMGHAERAQTAAAAAPLAEPAAVTGAAGLAFPPEKHAQEQLCTCNTVLV
jgi:hypothetical protein